MLVEDFNEIKKLISMPEFKKALTYEVGTVVSIELDWHERLIKITGSKDFAAYDIDELLCALKRKNRVH